MPEHEVGYWPSSFLRCYGPRQSQSPEKNQGLHPLFSASKPTIHLLFSASKPQFIQSLSRRANARNVSF